MNLARKISCQILCRGFTNDDDIYMLSIVSCSEAFFKTIVDQPIQSSSFSYPPPPTRKRISNDSQN